MREADGPLTVSMGLVTAREMPSSFKSLLSVDTGAASASLFPSATIPLASIVTGVPAMFTLVSSVDPDSVPLLPSEVAVAVEVTSPMVMKPSRMEMPESVAVAVPAAVAPGALEVDVPELPAIPMMAEEDANGLPVPVGVAVVPDWLPGAPAAGASSPRVAVAVSASAVEVVSMLSPGSSVDPLLGVCG